MATSAGLANPRGDAGRACVVALFVACSLVVLARLVTRVCIVKNPGFDDVTAVVAWLFNLGVTVAFCFEVDFGMGLHMKQLPPSNIQPLMKSVWVLILTYNLCLYWTKVAMIVQYLRIFPDPFFRKITFGILAFTTLVSLFTVTASIIFCIPVAAYWDWSIKAAYCLPHVITFYTCAGLNVFNDIIVLVLPLPVLRGLNLPTKQKIALIGVFALGFFVCVTSAIRLKKLSDVSQSKDISYSYVSVSVWSAIECSVGIICVSLPSLKATVTRYFPRILMPLRSAQRGFSKDDEGGGARGRGRGGRLRRDDHTLDALGIHDHMNDVHSVQSKRDGGMIGVTTVISQEHCAAHPGDEIILANSESGEQNLGGARTQRRTFL